MASKKRGEVQLQIQTNLRSPTYEHMRLWRDIYIQGITAWFLQTVINSQSLWEEMLQNKGLTVIDVYQAWCGPCTAMQPLFRKLKNETNEEKILHFVVTHTLSFYHTVDSEEELRYEGPSEACFTCAQDSPNRRRQAEADNIVTLQSFRDKCEPVFLFSVNGKIIAKIQGANAPLVNKKVITLINEEKKIAAGEMVRPQYPDILLIELEKTRKKPERERYSIAIIKPDAVLKRKAQEIKEKITMAGFVIEAEEKTMFTEKQVRDFYSQIADQPDFEEFLSFMTTGLSNVLIIAQEKEQDQVEENETELKETSEPPTESEVKKWDSLQKYLEQQHISQFCDVEDDEANVTKFTDVFFPDFKIAKGKKLQRTLALLRPDLLEKQDDVLKVIKDEDFEILMERQIVLSEEEAKMLCKEYEKENYFEALIEKMTRSPSLALVLLRENCVQHWKELLGPRTVEKVSEYHAESLCAQFAMGNLPINQLYGSDSMEAAERDIECFFPPENTLALIKPHVTREQRAEILKLIKEEGFELTQMKDMLLTPEQVGKIYFQITKKDFYKDIVEVLSEGQSLVMVLTKWNAIVSWRRLMGPVDPEEAKLLSPDSIRARFGINILKNAVHGSTNHYSATVNSNALFEEDAGEE
ncbi:thioredoxin domain-containing protein 3 isoform X3 [Heterocephalus glaber]|uniref:Thioredoxin domain-containing protein 3 isoform X3 n=1 Tax=Heterocephalus glaber TaxID=10181 RepID=A0AAX6SQG9_HETGA|nr:thioredoxin domain-containing protein 3 isoform X3 [Heterocephalus glaber]